MIDLQTQLEEAKQRVKYLEAQIANQPWWKTQEKYWYISDSAVGVGQFIGEWFAERQRCGNAFPTKQAAQKERDRRLSETRLKSRIAELNREQGWVADWGNSQQYQASYNHVTDDFSAASSVVTITAPNWMYGSYDTINNVIEAMPEDIKLVLGCGDDKN